jgi:hypothetical protein
VLLEVFTTRGNGTMVVPARTSADQSGTTPSKEASA